MNFSRPECSAQQTIPIIILILLLLVSAHLMWRLEPEENGGVCQSDHPVEVANVAR